MRSEILDSDEASLSLLSELLIRGYSQDFSAPVEDLRGLVSEFDKIRALNVDAATPVSISTFAV